MSRVDDAFKKACGDLVSGFPGQKTITVLNTKAAHIDEDERSAVTVVSSEAVDRDREVVMSRGLKLQAYKKNPVVLFMHNMHMVIGKSMWIKRQDRPNGIHRVIAKCLFAETDDAQEVYTLVKSDFMRATSIGMHPFSAVVRQPKHSELKARPELEGVRIIESAELLEWSWVSVPANPQALTTAYGKGLIKATMPYYDPILRAITDANPRKKPFVQVVSRTLEEQSRTKVLAQKRTVVVVPKMKPRVIVTPETLRQRVAIAMAKKAGRV